MKKYLGVILMLFMGWQTTAQKPPVKWGKVSDKEWELQQVSYDPQAAAVILCDYGVAQFAGGKLRVMYHRRLKILKPDGIKEADIEIPYYVKDRMQNVTGLKAHTLNLEQGKVVEGALSSKEFFQQDLSEDWRIAKFTFPKVAVGSILEYTYTLSSENVVFLRRWDFQNEYPTLHSEFRAAIPTYLNYKVIFQGSRLLQKYGNQPSSEWYLKNIPSLKPEPYMTTLEDYREKLRFQLTGYYAKDNGPSGGVEFKTLMTTWKELGKELMTHPHFGNQLGKRSFAKNIIEGLDLEGKSPQQQMEFLYGYVHQNIRWNKDYQYLAEHDLKEVHELKEGSSAEINLMLVMLLKQAGISADPVLISTRGHGMVSKNITLLSQFNHVIARTKIDGEEIFMDATDAYRPFNLLAEADLNQYGLVILKNQEPQWVEIIPTKKNVRNIVINLNLQDLKNPTANFECAVNGYFALESRKKALSETKLTLPLVQVSSTDSDLQFQHLEDLQKPLNIKSADIDIDIIDNGDLVYLQPMLINFYKENPFKSPTRNYPIDFGSPFLENYSVSILMPPGYQVEEIPESVALKLPRGYGHFQYLSEVKDDRIQLKVRLGISKPSMGYGLYGSLVEFYDLIISKLNAQLVLRRD